MKHRGIFVLPLVLIVGCSSAAFHPLDNTHPGSTVSPVCDSSCATDDSPDAGPTTYTYSVTGDAADASTVTYSDADGTIQQATDAGLPWSETVDASGDFYDVSAQDDAGGSSITCSITDDSTGVVVNQHTSVGQYAIVDCQVG